MARILALDSSTEACSCALALDTGIAEKFEIIPRGHTRRILPMIKELMDAHQLAFTDLDALALSAGPGSFTGLRIAAGVAQGIAFGADLPLIPVSTLAAMAQQKRHTEYAAILSCLDARINEVYWAVFSLSAGELSLHGKEQLSRPDALHLDQDIPLLGVGNGMQFIDQMPDATQKLLAAVDTEIYPRAAAIAELALIQWEAKQFMDPADFSPSYLRNQVTRS